MSGGNNDFPIVSSDLPNNQSSGHPMGGQTGTGPGKEVPYVWFLFFQFHTW